MASELFVDKIYPTTGTTVSVESATVSIGTSATTGTRLIVDSTGVRGGITTATAQASTSGTSIDFTGIPSWAKKITVMFDGVSSNGTSQRLVQVGVSTGVVTTGYASYWGVFHATNIATSATSTAGFGIWNTGAGETIYGHMILTNITGNTWVASHSGGMFNGTTNFVISGGGRVALSSTLDRIRITHATGTDAFDAGTINIMYEG